MNMGVFIGVTGGMVSVFLMVILKSLRFQPFYENSRWLICGGLALLGFVFLVAGLFFRPRPRLKLEEAEVPLSPPSPFLLASVPYWGFLFLLFGAAVAIISPETRTARAAEAKPTNYLTKPIVAMNPKFSIVGDDPSSAHAASTTNQ